jgi:lysophospholipase L1-like esterase
VRRSILLACAIAVALLALPGVSQAAHPQRYYVSLGDSYASGFQPTGERHGRNTRNGFAYQVPRFAARRGYRLKLVNFGCGGATTTSILKTKGCPRLALGPGGKSYRGRTQLRAAERFLRPHRRKTTLVTVSIGGNDVTACVKAPSPVSCVAAAVPRIKANVKTVARRLRRAAGRRVRIVGTTYPDVILGLYVNGDSQSQSLASLSVTAFKSLINPALKDAYKAGRGRLVDVTKASGAYIPFQRRVTLRPYGLIPTAVSRVCELSYFCAYGDIHLRTDGYALIAGLVARALPRRH